MVSEKNATLYHTKAAGVSEFLSPYMNSHNFVDNLIVYSSEDVFYRFVGNLSNTTLKRIAYSINTGSMPHYMALSVENNNYVGYVSNISYENEAVGFVVFLIEDSKLQNTFSRNNVSDDLEISLAANNEIIVSNNELITGQQMNAAKKPDTLFLSKNVGFTDLEIIVSSNGNYTKSIRSNFTVAVIITTLLFAFLIITFIVCWNNHFVRPALSIMRDVEELGTGTETRTRTGSDTGKETEAETEAETGTGIGSESIRSTNEEYFDALVEKINSMLLRIKENNRLLMEAQLKLQNAEISKQKAVIVSLKKQINAHFTVNILNIIKLLAEKNEMRKASEMCDGLSYLLRYANCGDEFIGGLEEFFILKKYITIMEIRYHNRFTAEFDIDDRLDDIKLPRMMIQPIIENSILHGFKYNKNGGIIKISAYISDRNTVVKSDRNIVIEIADNGSGIHEEELSKLRERILDAEKTDWNDYGIEHIALPNIQKRVVSYFGQGYGLRVDSKPDEGTIVTLTVPISIK